MITAVDTNILLDMLIPGQPFSEASKQLLDYHLSKGGLIVCEVVFAELASCFPSQEELKLFLSDTGMGLVPSSEESLFVAGERWTEYARKGGKNRFVCGKCGHAFEVTCPKCVTAVVKRLHVLGDFLVGAHALVQADCLLSRDLGVYKTYFRDLSLIGPR